MILSEIVAIDTHSHVNTDNPFDNEETTAYNAHIDYLNQTRVAANISYTFVSSFASVKDPASVIDENEKVCQLCRQNDYLRQWVVVDPRIDETFLQARRILQEKFCVGIKLHPPYHKYTLDEYGDKVFTFAAELGARVLIHPEGKATHILPMADKYKDVTFIMAHLNGKHDDHIAAIERSKHQNIYTDVATSGSVSNRSVEYAVSCIGSERILFGTDTYAAGFVRGRIEYALISEKDKINILRENAVRLFSDKL